MLQKRSIPMCIVLSIVTCGIYMLYWFVKVTDEVNLVTEQQDTTGGMSLLFDIITCGIYGIYWGWKIGGKLEWARARRGIPGSSMNILFLVLNLFGLTIVTLALVQDELNRYNAAW